MKFVTLIAAQVLALLAVAAMALALSSGPASADEIKFVVDMDGPQSENVCLQGSAGTGSGQVTLDDVTNEINWTLTWQDLSGAAIDAHFHGPAGPGVNAVIQVGIGDLTPPSVGSAFIDDTQEADLLAGLWYVNIHTAKCPVGEIRGQVLQAPAPVGGISLDLPAQSGDGGSLAWFIVAGSAAALAGVSVLAWRRVKA
ncbi:MAG: CHRD domain-containing protein [Dehalococcoidia bacterium]